MTSCESNPGGYEASSLTCTLDLSLLISQPEDKGLVLRTRNEKAVVASPNAPQNISYKFTFVIEKEPKPMNQKSFQVGGRMIVECHPEYMDRPLTPRRIHRGGSFMDKT
jgi:hypothetical protein